MARLFGLGSGPRRFEFRCACCGKIHRGSPSFSLHRPEHIFDVPEADRPRRVQADDDLCIIHPADGEGEEQAGYWIRATLEIPIHGADDPFCWGVWVTQSRASFDRYVQTFDEDQSGDGSFGWLPVHMQYYRSADGSWPWLECDVNWGVRGQRPQIVLRECDHQLYRDQRDGISWDKAIEIAAPLMHGK